jgi:hypothetical protein
MADVYPTAAGAWSTRTWNDDATGAAYGGPPLAGDNVHANGVAITIDVDITVAELRTTAGTTAVAGGSFTTSGTGRVVNSDSLAGTTTCLSLVAGIQNGDSYGSASTTAARGTSANGGGIQNGNSYGGSANAAHGTIMQQGSIQNGNSFAGSNASHGTNLSNGAFHIGNANGGAVSGAHGTSLATGSIFNGNATGGTTSGSHGVAVAAGSYVFVTTATGNTSGAFGVNSTATTRYVAIIQNESGITPKSLTAQAETTSTNVPFVQFEQLAAPQSILAYGSAS